MRNTTQSRNRPDNRSFEVLATIHLPKNRRIEIDRELDPLVDAPAIDGSVEQIDAVFIRIYRGMKKVEVALPSEASTGKLQG